MFTNLAQHIKSQKSSEYDYYIIGAVLSKDPQPVTNTVFDEYEFARLPFSINDDMGDPQLYIGYNRDILTATLEHYDKLAQAHKVELAISVDNAVKLMTVLSSTYKMINVFGCPFHETPCSDKCCVV